MSRRFFSGVGAGIKVGLLRKLRVQLNYILRRTAKLNCTIFLKLLLKQNSCCAPQSPFTASCYEIVGSQTSFMLY